MSEANRQTKSKDLMLVGRIQGNNRSSDGAPWVILILLLFLSLIPTAFFAQTARKFPGTKSELASPDKRWVLQDIDRDQEPNHSIFLKDTTTGKTRKICDYERSASVVWSPDSRHFALNDYAGSNFSETSVLSVDETVPKIDVQDEILDQDERLRERITLVGLGHDYFGVVRWLDAHRVVVHHWGHNDEPPLGDFCACYVYTLGGTVQKCAHEPKASDLEGLCSKTTP